MLHLASGFTARLRWAIVPGLLLFGGCADVLGPTGGVVSVELDPAPPASLQLGEEFLLRPFPLSRSGERIDAECVIEFSSSDPDVASVSDGGTLRALESGTTTITVRINGVPRSFPLTVLAPAGPPPSLLALAAGDLHFEAVVGAPSPTPDTIAVLGTPTSVSGLSVQIDSIDGPAGWVALDLSDTSTPASLIVTPTTTTVPAGTYRAFATVSGASADPATLAVTLVMVPASSPEPSLQLSLSDVEFESIAGGADPEPASVLVTASPSEVTGLALDVQASDGDPEGWLQATLEAETTPASILLAPSSAGLPPGRYTMVLTVSGAGAKEASARVVLNVREPDPETPALRLSATGVTFDAVAGGDDPAPKHVALTSSGIPVSGLALEVVNTEGSDWLAATLEGTTTPTTVELRPTTGGLTPGRYNVTLRVTGEGAHPAEVPVTLLLRVDDGGPTPQLRAAEDTVRFQWQVGTAAPAPHAVSITSEGDPVEGLTLDVVHPAASPTGWLSVGFAGGGTSTPASAVLSALPGALVVGTYQAEVIVDAAGAEPATVVVVLEVQAPPPPPPALLSGQDTVSFTWIAGMAAPAPQQIAITSDGSPVSGLTLQVVHQPGQPGGWLAAGFAGGGASTPATVIAGPQGSAPAGGTYQAGIMVSAPGAAAVEVVVILVVQAPPPPPHIQVDTTVVVFTAPEGTPPPPPDSLSVLGGGGTITSLTARIEYRAGQPTGWLTATLTDSSTPSSLILQSDPDGLSAGTYNATVFLEAPGVQTIAVPVELRVTAAVIIGLELDVDAVVPALGEVLALSLTDLLSDPVLDVTVWALMSNETRQDVTNLAALTTSQPLLTIDASGTLNLAGVLVNALVDPEHYVHAGYGGFQARADLRIEVPLLSSLPIVGVVIPPGPSVQLGAGSALPSVRGALDNGLGGTVELIVPAGHAGLTWSATPRPTGIFLADLVLGPLGNVVGTVLGISGGVVQSVNLGPLSGILGLLGNTLAVDLRASIAGTTSSSVTGLIPLN